MGKYTIMPASGIDIEDIVRLVNLAYRGGEAAGWTSEGAYLDGERTDAGSIEALLAKPASVMWKCVAEDGRLAGCVYLEEEEDGYLHLGTFAISPAIQAQGLGRMMLERANIYAREKGFDRIMITVVSARAELIDWYIRRGFERTGRRMPFPAKWGQPRLAVDFVEMQRLLDR